MNPIARQRSSDDWSGRPQLQINTVGRFVNRIAASIYLYRTCAVERVARGIIRAGGGGAAQAQCTSFGRLGAAPNLQNLQEELSKFDSDRDWLTNLSESEGSTCGRSGNDSCVQDAIFLN